MSVVMEAVLRLDHTLADMADADTFEPVHRHKAKDIPFTLTTDQITAMDETGEWLDGEGPCGS